MYSLEGFTTFLEQQTGLPQDSLGVDYITFCYNVSVENQQQFLVFSGEYTQELLVYLYATHLAVFFAYTDPNQPGMNILQQIQTTAGIGGFTGLLSSTSNGASASSFDIPDFAKKMSTYNLASTKWGAQWLAMTVSYRTLGALV